MNALLNATLTLTGNIILNILNAQPGQFLFLVIKQDTTGSHAITLPASSKVVNNGSGYLTLTGTANSIDILSGFYDGTNYFWLLNKNFS